MQVKNVNGIIYFEEPYIVNFVTFGYDHLDCDSIITRRSALSGKAEVELICYASSKEYNNRLRELINTRYNGNDYCIMQRISSEEASCID